MINEERAFAPHCDASILHGPGKCEYCAEYSDWQSLRELWQINFTGEYDPAKAPCPSTYFREPGMRLGNRAKGYKHDL